MFLPKVSGDELNGDRRIDAACRQTLSFHLLRRGMVYLVDVQFGGPDRSPIRKAVEASADDHVLRDAPFDSGFQRVLRIASPGDHIGVGGIRTKRLSEYFGGVRRCHGSLGRRHAAENALEQRCANGIWNQSIAPMVFKQRSGVVARMQCAHQ